MRLFLEEVIGMNKYIHSFLQLFSELKKLRQIEDWIEL